MKIDELHARGKRALIVGGSGFYLKALVYGLWDAPKADLELRANLESRTSQDLYGSLFAVDEESALRIGVNDRYRLVRAHEILAQSGKTPSALRELQGVKIPDPRLELLWIDRDTTELDARIHERTLQMVQTGILDETDWLMKNHPESRTLLATGYAETYSYLRGIPPAGRQIQAGLDGLTDEIDLATRQLVKKQRKFFRSQFSHASRYLLDQDCEALIHKLSQIYPLP